MKGKRGGERWRELREAAGSLVGREECKTRPVPFFLLPFLCPYVYLLYSFSFSHIALAINVALNPLIDWVQRYVWALSCARGGVV